MKFKLPFFLSPHSPLPAIILGGALLLGFIHWILIWVVGLALLAMIWQRRKKEAYKRRNPRSSVQEGLPVILHQHTIQFPEGYYFKYGTPNDCQPIDHKRIAGFNLNTLPVSFVLDNREVIFVKGVEKEGVIRFCARNHIPILNTPDLWEIINSPFLDTSFEPEEIAGQERVLAENGISKTQLQAIRRKIKYTMWQNFFAWEWAYLGQFDYLRWTWLTKKKYWWSMEIALSKNQHAPTDNSPVKS